MNPEKEGTVNGYWMPTVVFSKETKVARDKLLKAFRSENIDARVFFWPLSSLPMFDPKPENEWAWDIPGRAINLPTYHDLTIEEIDRICNILISIL